MKQEIKLNNINQNYSLAEDSFETSDFFQLNIHNTSFLTGRGIFIDRNHREHSAANFHSDYIEQEPTLAEAEKSTIQNSFIKSLTKCMQCSLNNIRPHVIFNKAINLIKALN